jgi:hypothetical protein
VVQDGIIRLFERRSVCQGHTIHEFSVLPVAGVTRNEAAKYKSNPEQSCTNKECCSSCDCNLILYSQSFEPCNPTSKRSQDSHIGASRRITRTRRCTRIEYVSGNAPYLAVLVAACYSWTMTRLWCFSRSQYTVLSIVFSIKMLHRSTPYPIVAAL